MRSIMTGLVALILCLTLSGTVTAQNPLNKMLDAIKKQGSSQGGETSGSNVTQGLKEALRVGTDKAVARTGRTDGYFGNALIKILLPKKFRSIEKGLRIAGQGPAVDEFILSMNRAAEKAAPRAKSIFVDAITSMTFADAQKIFQGGDTAATDFFKDKTSKQLYSSFRPVVDKSMNQVGTVQKYNAMVGQVGSLPFVKSQSLDVGGYVTNKALDGLFAMVAQEERQIRQNPAARVTPLLQQVFGR